MKLKDVEQKLASELRAPLAELGFRYPSLLIWRREATTLGVTHLLAFAPRERARNVFSCGCGVGIRFDAIEAIVRSDSDPNRPTLGMPIHLLAKEQSYFEWEFAPEDIRVVIPEMIEVIVQDAIPFLQQFSNINAVRKKLESDNARDHFALSQEARAGILAAIIAFQEGYEDAVRFLDAELQKRASCHPKYRTQLVLLKRRLETLGRRST